MGNFTHLAIVNGSLHSISLIPKRWTSGWIRWVPYNPFSFLLSEAILAIQPVESGAAGPMQVIHREDKEKANSAALPSVLLSKRPSQSFYFRELYFCPIYTLLLPFPLHVIKN